MNDPQPHPDASELAPARDAQALHAEFERTWANPRGWRALSIVSHSTVAARFIVTSGVFFLIAGVLSMLIRTQLARPEATFMGPEAYNQAFTAHGTMMMFLFAVPVLLGLGAYLLPKMLGARDLVFPRLGAFGYWCFLFGGVIFTSSLALGLAPNAGWFMYTPLSGRVHSPGLNADFWLIGITFVEIATLAAGIEVAVSILRGRTRGMTLERMPVFAWAMLVTAMMIIVGFPPLILGSILLELERAAGWVFFDPTKGGDPLLWQHLFWLFGHPEVYIIFLPAAGIVSTLVPVFARRPLVGYRWVVISMIATGFLSFGLWVHHMFTVGIPALAQAFFSAASMLVAIPTAVQLFAWVATLWAGRPVWRLPMLWIAGFLAIFVCGGLTGVMLALVPFNWQVHDTHFVVAHFHYVLIGGMLFPLIAALYHWLPLASGRMPSERLGRWGFWLTFIGFNGTFLVMHWTGLLGMPRRVYTYEAGLGWDWPNLVSSIFGYVMAFGIANVLIDLATHWRIGRRAGFNPWQAGTLEWACGMPPRVYNFASLPVVGGRYPLWEQPTLADEIATGRHALAQAAHGRRETLGIDPVTSRAREVLHLPGNSWWPLVSAALIAGFCVGLLLKLYWIAIVFAFAAFVALLRWSWENGAHPTASGREGHQLPAGLELHARTFDGPGRWGMGLTMLADGAIYASLLFAWLFLWTVSPSWEQPPTSPLAVSVLGTGSLAAISAVLGAGWLALRRVEHRLRAGREDGLVRLLSFSSLAAGLGAAGLLWLLASAPLSPQTNAHDAILAFALCYLLLHAAVGSLIAALQALRARLGYVGIRAPYEPGVVAIWQGFVASACLIGWVAFALLPLAF